MISSPCVSAGSVGLRQKPQVTRLRMGASKVPLSFQPDPLGLRTPPLPWSRAKEAIMLKCPPSRHAETTSAGSPGRHPSTLSLNVLTLAALAELVMPVR